jgi:queuine tRNA-ribosyltransferase
MNGIGQSKKMNAPNLVLKINEDGVTFRSYRDGSKHSLTPEKSIQLQKVFLFEIH